MEENRLRPMAKDYDQKLFNKIYGETQGLRIKLARQIDCRRFGLPFEDILSFFDVKFIFAFNKHWEQGDSPEKIKAMLINALQNFKCRILRAAYTKKFSQSISPIDDVNFNDLIAEEDNKEKDAMYDKAMEFMQQHLSDNAFVLLQIQIHPPPYILSRINVSPDKPLQKIPDQLLMEYLDLGYSDKAYKYIKTLKKEIKSAILFARQSLN